VRIALIQAGDEVDTPGVSIQEVREARESRSLKRLLSLPLIYNGFQNLLSGSARRSSLLSRYLDVPEHGRVLDIGCGTANVLEHLPHSVEYVGFDASADYIDFATRKYAARRASFHRKLIEMADVDDLGAFDVVLATGILHHLDDAAANRLFELSKSALSKGGALFAMDPCFVEGQRWLARRLVGNDRGEHVRPIGEYAELARRHFDDVTAFHRSDLLRVPYDHSVMICRR
jgi:SAM-dependent methyltransferase